MTAKEARQVTDQNTMSAEAIDNAEIQKIEQMIATDAKMGGDMISVYANRWSDTISKHFHSLGYTITFKKGLTLMDNDVYYIEW